MKIINIYMKGIYSTSYFNVLYPLLYVLVMCCSTPNTSIAASATPRQWEARSRPWSWGQTTIALI